MDVTDERALWWTQGSTLGDDNKEFKLREQEVPHLQNISAAVMAAAGKAAFTVAGVIPPSSFPDGIALTFKNKHGSDTTLNLPCEETDPAFKALKKACQPAKFGRGTELVYDEKVRKALAMPVDQISSCSFKVEDYQEEILDTIHKLMMPGSAGVTAKLDKLNIYRPGDFFKKHEDTPRVNETFFGSLVVCLPVGEHVGGGLSVKANAYSNQIITHFFGRNAGRGEIAWAAHFSEISHEVEKVEKGHRLTLTYQLFAKEAAHNDANKKKEKKEKKEKVKINEALKAALENALHDATFMPSGGKLGFPCIHRYAHTSRGASPSNIKSLLKGNDSDLVSTLSQFPGVTTTVVRVWRVAEGNQVGINEFDCEGSAVLGNATGYQRRLLDIDWIPIWTSDTFKPYFEIEPCEVESVDEMIQRGDPDAKPSPEIRWVGGTPLTGESFKQWVKAAKADIFGNEDCTEEFAYATLAVVVQVPSFEERRQQYGGGAGPSTA